MKPLSPSKNRKEQFKVYAAIILPILALVYVHAAAHIMFYRIELGMHEREVERIYGAPDKNEATMIFCERIFEWSGECPPDSSLDSDPNADPDADQDPAKGLAQQPLSSYQFFKKGIDRWVVIGFDSEHRVAFKTIGSL